MTARLADSRDQQPTRQIATPDSPKRVVNSTMLGQLALLQITGAGIRQALSRAAAARGVSTATSCLAAEPAQLDTSLADAAVESQPPATLGTVRNNWTCVMMYLQ